MKKILIICISLFLFTSRTNSKLISDQKAQNYVDNIIAEKIIKLEKGEYGESVLIESYNNLPTATWNDIYDLLFNYLKQNLEAEVIKDLKQNGDIDGPKFKIYKRNFSKENMLLNFLMVQDLETTASALSSIIHELNEIICYDSYLSYKENNKSYENAKHGQYFCHNNKNYNTLLAGLANILKVGEEIRSYSYKEEKNKFIKKVGKDISVRYPLVETLFNYMTRTPDKQSVYHLENIKAIQNVKGGVLVSGSSIFNGDIYPDKAAMIYTNKKFVTNEHLYSYGNVVFVGTYDYISALGVNQTVYAYKFFDMDNWKQYKLNKDDFYFYPEYKKDFSENKEFEKGFDTLIYIKIGGKTFTLSEFIQYGKHPETITKSIQEEIREPNIIVIEN